MQLTTNNGDVTFNNYDGIQIPHSEDESPSHSRQATQRDTVQQSGSSPPRAMINNSTLTDAAAIYGSVPVRLQGKIESMHNLTNFEFAHHTKRPIDQRKNEHYIQDEISRSKKRSSSPRAMLAEDLKRSQCETVSPRESRITVKDKGIADDQTMLSKSLADPTMIR